MISCSLARRPLLEARSSLSSRRPCRSSQPGLPCLRSRLSSRALARASRRSLATCCLASPVSRARNAWTWGRARRSAGSSKRRCAASSCQRSPSSRLTSTTSRLSSTRSVRICARSCARSLAFWSPDAADATATLSTEQTKSHTLLLTTFPSPVTPVPGSRPEPRKQRLCDLHFLQRSVLLHGGADLSSIPHEHEGQVPEGRVDALDDARHVLGAGRGHLRGVSLEFLAGQAVEGHVRERARNLIFGLETGRKMPLDVRFCRSEGERIDA